MSKRNPAKLGGVDVRTLSEAEWQAWVIRLARRYGWLAVVHRPAMVKGRWITNTSHPVPDLMLIRASTGEIGFLELKKELRWEWKPGQEELLAQLAACPGLAFVRMARPSDYADVIRLLAPRDRGNVNPLTQQQEAP